MASITGTTGNDALGKCIASAAKKWLFPKPPGGGLGAAFARPKVLAAVCVVADAHVD